MINPLQKISVPRFGINVEDMRNGTGFAKLKKTSIWHYLLIAAAVWLIDFVISEIIISGGLYTRSVWLVLVEILTVSFFLMIFKQTPQDAKERLKCSITNFITFIVLDFFAVYLLLESSNRDFFRFWGTWAIYLLVFVYPLVRLKKKSSSDIGSMSDTTPQENDLLTKDSYSL